MRLGVSVILSVALGLPGRVNRFFHRRDQGNQVPRIARERRPRSALDREGAIIVQALHDHRRVPVSGHESVDEPATVGGDDVVLEITGGCDPCQFIDDIRDGMRAEMEGKRGMLAYVTDGGTIKKGDPISLA